jgi:DNA-binding GntR family transcriptional regulator
VAAERRADRIRQSLEQDIVTGALPPGRRLDEVRLAERFAVSRTPVREALMQLSASGLVEIRPRQGATVAALGLKRMVEMFEVMAELEGLCARMAARRMSTDERAELQRIHAVTQRFVASPDPDAYYAANLDFHEAIYAGSHNGFLAEQTRALRQRLAPYRRIQLRRQGRIADSFAEHEAVVRAILAGDAEEAGRLASQHVTVQRGAFTDFLSTLPTGGAEPAAAVGPNRTTG